MFPHPITREVSAIISHKLDAAIEKQPAMAAERKALGTKLAQFYRYNGYVPDVLLKRGPIED